MLWLGSSMAPVTWQIDRNSLVIRARTTEARVCPSAEVALPLAALERTLYGCWQSAAGLSHEESLLPADGGRLIVCGSN